MLVGKTAIGEVEDAKDDPTKAHHSRGARRAAPRERRS